MILPPLRVWVLAVLSTLFLLLLGYIFLERWGLLLGFMLSLLWNYLLLLHPHKNSIAYLNGQLLQGQDPWKLNELLQYYENQFRCPRVRLYLCQNPEPICLISTSHWQKPELLLSESLLTLLSSAEVESLIALCVSSIKHRNTFAKYTLDRMALTWLSLGKACTRFFQPLNSLNFIKQICFFIACLHWKLAFPKSAQIRADLETYKTLSDPRSLASALWKIHGALNTIKTQPTHQSPLPKIFTHQSLLGTPRRTAFQFILPIELRLRLLIGYFPI